MGPRRHALLLAVGAAVAVGIGLWLALGLLPHPANHVEGSPANASPDDPTFDEFSAPSLPGRGRREPPDARFPVPPTAKPTPLGLHGRVFDPDGAPIAKADVYLLPMDLPGVHAGVPHAVTEADGSFRLPSDAPLGGRRLCVRHRAFHPVYQDAASLPVAESLDVVLHPGAVVRLRLEGEGAASSVITRARVDPIVEGNRWRLPGPSAEGYFDCEADMDGRTAATLRIGTWAPLRVTVTRWGKHVAEPPDVTLPPGGGEAVFRFLPSCALEVLALAAESREPIRTGVTLALEGPESTGNGRLGLVMQLDDDGIVAIESGIPPGRYVARVWAKDRHAVVLDDVAFTHHGERQHRTVRLERIPDDAFLVLRSAIHGERPRRQAPAVFWRSRDEEAPRWRSAGDVEAIEGVVGAWRVRGVGKGSVDLLAMDGVHGELAAYAEAVHVRPGEPNEAELVWRSGVRVSLPELLPAPALAHWFELRADPIGTLPLVQIRPESESFWGDSATRKFPGSGALLGPYPVDRVEVGVHLHGEEEPRTFGVPAPESTSARAK